ncbi:MAG TPA: LamG domain-containing protein [Chitinophagaceae bacterium]|nr:LamG domain-containing protein [Chitinophagaceae bacterium]
MERLIKLTSVFIILAFIFSSCQKLERPVLSKLIEDANPPNGPLRFYAAMNGSGTDQLRNAVDSIRANFPSVNDLTSIDGISGKAMQGVDGKSIVYASANDMNKATSFTIAFWMKNTDEGRTEFVFSLVDDKYGWHHSAIFLLLEHGNTTATTLKLGLMDQWLEWPDANKFPKPLLDGNWHHIAFVYDENTSKLTYYFDGSVVTGAPAGATDVKNGSNPRGALDLKSANKLILGGWNKHGGAQGPQDDWIKSYKGGLDQFRMYNKALSASEIQALFTNKL